MGTRLDEADRLRLAALSSACDEFGFSPLYDRPFLVMMEVGQVRGTTTLVAIRDKNPSLFVSADGLRWKFTGTVLPSQDAESLWQDPRSGRSTTRFSKIAPKTTAVGSWSIATTSSTGVSRSGFSHPITAIIAALISITNPLSRW